MGCHDPDGQGENRRVVGFARLTGSGRVLIGAAILCTAFCVSVSISSGVLRPPWSLVRL